MQFSLEGDVLYVSLVASVHTYVCMYMHACVHTHMRVCAHTHTHTHKHTHAHTHTHTHTNTYPVTPPHTHIPTHTPHTHTYPLTHPHTHIPTHTHPHTHTHSHTPTHTDKTSYFFSSGTYIFTTSFPTPTHPLCSTMPLCRIYIRISHLFQWESSSTAFVSHVRTKHLTVRLLGNQYM